MTAKRNKDNIGWRYCLFMLILCLVLGAISHNCYIIFQQQARLRVWEVRKIQMIDRCASMMKLAIGVTMTEKPGPPELRAWSEQQLARERVPEHLRQDYDDWQKLKAINAVLAQMEFFDWSTTCQMRLSFAMIFNYWAN